MFCLFAFGYCASTTVRHCFLPQNAAAASSGSDRQLILRVVVGTCDRGRSWDIVFNSLVRCQVPKMEVEKESECNKSWASVHSDKDLDGNASACRCCGEQTHCKCWQHTALVWCEEGGKDATIMCVFRLTDRVDRVLHQIWERSDFFSLWKRYYSLFHKWLCMIEFVLIHRYCSGGLNNLITIKLIF